jgi:hypothetical protein
MTTIDGIEFNLSNPINKHWYSKCKKSLIKNDPLLTSVINDAKNKNKIKYTPRYYAYAKFIKATTNLRYKKIQDNIYYIAVFNDDFLDCFQVNNKKDLVCNNKLQWQRRFDGSLSGGKQIGKCKNGCCIYHYKIRRSFYIQWI